MATNYTSLLGFALPTTGELDGTWGTTVNNSITELVEDAIAATATASVASGNWTLSTTGSGATNEARCAILIPTGSPGTSRNIIAPSQSKAYIVINQSNASVVLKGSATTGTTIAAGDKALVAWNGSDFVQVISSASSAAGGSNTQVQYNSSGSFAGSANLTFDGTTLTAANFADSSLTSGRVTYSASGGNLTDSASLTFDGSNLQIGSQGDLRLGDSDNSNYVAIQAPSTLAANYTLTLPTTDGDANQVLTTDGSGGLSWGTPASAGVTSFSAGTTGLTPSTATGGVVTLAGTLALANGGTGATTAANARTNLGLGTVATLSSISLTSNVTGTLPIANGGTGQTGTPTNGQLLIGNGSGFARATLTAGTGVTITNGAGTITIAATGTSGVTSLAAGTGISVSASTGAVTVTNTGVTSLTGTSNQISVSGSTGSVTLSTPQSIGTASSVQFGSFGVGTAASGTTGEIRATNNVTAYYSSDRKFKENIREIDGALSKVDAIGGKYFDWTDDYLKEKGGEDGYFVTKSDFGVIAQDVHSVFPVAVRTRDDGSLAVDYEKMCALAFAAIKELKKEVDDLRSKLNGA